MVYDIQSPYYDENFSKRFKLSDQEALKLRGWREFFYGTEKKASQYWKKLNPGIFSDSRILIASIVLLFPQSFILWFKENRVKFRLMYFMKYFKSKNAYMRKFLASYIKKAQ